MMSLPHFRVWHVMHGRGRNKVLLKVILKAEVLGTDHSKRLKSLQGHVRFWILVTDEMGVG